MKNYINNFQINNSDISYPIYIVFLPGNLYPFGWNVPVYDCI